eukprot:gene33877-43765_t
MEEEFKVFLTKKEITADEYKGGSLEVKAKLVEAFALEKSKAQGKLSYTSFSDPVDAAPNPPIRRERKIIRVAFESDHGIPTSQTYTLSSSSAFEGWFTRHQIVHLRQPDNLSVDQFSDLVNNGEYRAFCKSDGWKHRDQVDDSILEVEASNHLLSALVENYPHSHIHHNVRLFDESGKRSFREYDALIHGHDIIAPSVGFLIECKYVPHPRDIGNLLHRAAELEGWLKAGKSFPAKEGTLTGLQQDMDFQHLFNVQRVVPVMAGKLFHHVNMDECVAKGVLPV